MLSLFIPVPVEQAIAFLRNPADAFARMFREFDGPCPPLPAEFINTESLIACVHRDSAIEYARGKGWDGVLQINLSQMIEQSLIWENHLRQRLDPGTHRMRWEITAAGCSLLATAELLLAVLPDTNPQDAPSAERCQSARW